MDLSLSKLPWWGQIGAFVLVCAGAVYGFWHFYVAEMAADIKVRQTRLTALKADVARGVATARRLPEFESQVAQLEGRLENLKEVLPEEKDVADILRRVQGLERTLHAFEGRGSGVGHGGLGFGERARFGFDVGPVDRQCQ